MRRQNEVKEEVLSRVGRYQEVREAGGSDKDPYSPSVILRQDSQGFHALPEPRLQKGCRHVSAGEEVEI